MCVGIIIAAAFQVFTMRRSLNVFWEEEHLALDTSRAGGSMDELAL